MSVPTIRLRDIGGRPRNEDGSYVLYWMTAARRTGHNFALQHAAGLAKRAGSGLVVLEALRCEYPWASDRLHSFVIDGMADNQRALAGSAVTYYPYLEQARGGGAGLLVALAGKAIAVVTDDFPCFFLPSMLAAAGRKLATQLIAVDGNGLYPMADTDRVFTTAASFRRHLQKSIRPHLAEMPLEDPLRGFDGPVATVPDDVRSRWPAIDADEWVGNRKRLAALPIDHQVAPTALRGGSAAGANRLRVFLDEGMARYGERNQPDADAASGLSPYLHFGFISAHEVFTRVMTHDGWDPSRIADKATGSREGWWGASTAVESFLDELVTWREIGFNMCHKRADYADFDSLPGWAKKTLADHAGDQRAAHYSVDQLAAAETDDPIWNAAQRQLRDTGVIHNYLRMLWGKRILEWTPSPRDALAALIELNNRFALDGRDPNSYSGIFWVLGRYDRAWGPERPIFGKVRYMSSASTKRKLRLSRYLERFGAATRLIPD